MIVPVTRIVWSIPSSESFDRSMNLYAYLENRQLKFRLSPVKRIEGTTNMTYSIALEQLRGLPEDILRMMSSFIDDIRILPRNLMYFKASLVQENSLLIRFEWVEYHVIVTTMKGRRHSIKCNPFDTVDELKEKIQKESSIPWDNQRLWRDMKTLEGHQTLDDYRIPAGGMILQLYRRLPERNCWFL